jgi:hypothetical protein
MPPHFALRCVLSRRCIFGVSCGKGRIVKSSVTTCKVATELFIHMFSLDAALSNKTRLLRKHTSESKSIDDALRLTACDSGERLHTLILEATRLKES